MRLFIGARLAVGIVQQLTHHEERHGVAAHEDLRPVVAHRDKVLDRIPRRRGSGDLVLSGIDHAARHVEGQPAALEGEREGHIEARRIGLGKTARRIVEIDALDVVVKAHLDPHAEIGIAPFGRTAERDGRIDVAGGRTREADVAQPRTAVALEDLALHLVAVTLERLVDEVAQFPFGTAIDQLQAQLLVHE